MSSLAGGRLQLASGPGAHAPPSLRPATVGFGPGNERAHQLTRHQSVPLQGRHLRGRPTARHGLRESELGCGLVVRANEAMGLFACLQGEQHLAA